MSELEKHNSLYDFLDAQESGINFDLGAIEKEIQKQKGESSGLAVKILTIAGGLLATSTFLGFIMAVRLFDSATGLLVVGTTFITGGVWLNKKVDKLLIDTLCISLYCIGFFLIGFGLDKLGIDVKIINLIFIVVATIVLYFNQNYAFVFLSVLNIQVSFLMFLLSLNDYFIHFYIALNASLLFYWMLNEPLILSLRSKLTRLYYPVRIGLILTFLLGLVFVGVKGFIVIAPYNWLSSIITIPAVLYIISVILKIIEVNTLRNKILIYVLSFAILISTALSPAISGAILILMLSFHVNEKIGFAIGILALIFFIAQFYYDLNFTLLVKSVIMFTSGILFLLMYFFSNKKLIENEEI